MRGKMLHVSLVGGVTDTLFATLAFYRHEHEVNASCLVRCSAKV